MALKLSLKPGERVVVNGAVLMNGEKRTTLVVQNKASILRERDIMVEAEANTPARRVYFAVMLTYMDAANASEYYQSFVERMSEFMGAIENPQAKLVCAQVSVDMMERNYYRALTGCRKLVEYEAQVLGSMNVAHSISESSGNRRVA